MFSSFNPSMVAFNGRMYWCQRFSNWNECHRRPRRRAESFPLLCSAPLATREVPLCVPKLFKATVPPPDICIRNDWSALGIEDVRLFVHSTGLWGLGCYSHQGCFEMPLLAQFAPHTLEVLRYVHINDWTFDRKVRTKNWVVIDGSERSDGSMAVVKGRNPLVVAWLDVVTGTVTDTTELARSSVLDPSLNESDAARCQMRGSSGYIPFIDAHGREGLLTTLHIHTKRRGYFNIFVFTEKEWPYRTLSRSPYFYLNDLGLVKWVGRRLPELPSPTIQFLTGLAYAGAW
eukprot:CAMPEP_0184675426 /NCGR_PEP_ID=MMETSP0308-20130426/87418_1 /TAXON_ID=38269 /ORGANISM="Gloeochaete witrockiana, Strain SAG 46.84" /LENGTH=287 /DNA_ID=CAMNT_0027123127 /DNA_START=784 /DNA_END=1644 /DNA_ORIENTATION=-